MAKKISEYRCLVISPNDVKTERRELQNVIQNWNAHIGKTLNARVEFLWERHAVPELGENTQNIINKPPGYFGSLIRL